MGIITLCSGTRGLGQKNGSWPHKDLCSLHLRVKPEGSEPVPSRPPATHPSRGELNHSWKVHLRGEEELTFVLEG